MENKANSSWLGRSDLVRWSGPEPPLSAIPVSPAGKFKCKMQVFVYPSTTEPNFDRFCLLNQFYDGFKCPAEDAVIQVVEGALTF